MSKGKKFDYRVVADKKTWTAEIVRKVTSKKFHVSKSKDGFATEADAINWGKLELKSLVQNLADRNKRESH